MTGSTTIDSSRRRLARVLAMVVAAALQAAGVSAQTPTWESPASPYCEPAERRAIPPGAWVPPYEGLALPADTAQLAARVSDADSAVWIDGDVLTIVRRDPRAPLMIVGTFFCPMNRIGDTDVWALRLRMAGWDGVFFSYEFATSLTQGRPDSAGHGYFRGSRAPALPERKADLDGRLIETFLQSRHLNEQRAITAYLPAHAEGGTLPALFVADGQMTAELARVLEPVIESGRTRPFAIVGVHSGERRAQEYVPAIGGERFESHMRFFLDEVLPWAERELGVSQERADRALHGASNGGGFVTAVGVRHAALFGNVLPFSTVSIERAPIEPEPGAELPRFTFAAGTLEPFLAPTRSTYDRVRGWGAEATIEVYASGHDQLLWQLALVDALPRIFPPAR